MGIVHNVHNHHNAAEIDLILAQYVPANMIAYLADSGMRIVPLPTGTTYAHASPEVRRLGAGVDDWPVPPAGLFVVEERTVYLRAISSLTVIHELGHALDCALGGGVYRSSVDPVIRRAFAHATQFVTPYAATAIDEFFAETWRAYLGANDPNSLWPTVTRERLGSYSPTMLTFFENIEVELEQSQSRAIAATGPSPGKAVMGKRYDSGSSRGRSR